ncbi:hypothetical protein A2U01_0086929, partial [Trifolium medium]|nr:hypothetical protein [Trifolium medium]
MKFLLPARCAGIYDTLRRFIQQHKEFSLAVARRAA